jgi:hypothetical protein
LSDTETLRTIADRLAAMDDRLAAISDHMVAAGRVAAATANFGNATHTVVGDGLKAVVNNLIAIGQSAHYATAGGTGALVAKDLLLRHGAHALYAAHPNPLVKFGRKCFSQTDEDGITLEIVRRLGVENGRFAEFGVGDGLENNTIILGALGWSGFWVGGEDLAFDASRTARLRYAKDWITLENIVGHARAGLEFLGQLGAGRGDELDVISLDLDGNDIYFVAALLKSGLRPKLFIVEYNAKFPPPARFQISYDAANVWVGDDYMGAALANFSDLFGKHGFRLVCCNACSGTNAFFVRGEYSGLFGDVPEDIRDVYAEPRYHTYQWFAHRTSARTVESLFS